MSALKHRVPVGVSVLAFLAAFAAPAHAATVYGGGSSMIAYPWRQIGDCVGTYQQLLIDLPPVISRPITSFCVTSPGTNTIHYVSNSSIKGIEALYAHDATLYGDIDPFVLGVQNWPSVQYGLSEVPLTAADVAAYNSGGTVHGVTVGTPNYPVPGPKFGAVVQFPIAIGSIAVAFDPVFRKVRNADATITNSSFNLVFGELRLDANTYCKIFNGQISDWNDPALTALNAGASLTGGVSVPMQIVGRQGKSGATGIFTRHLAAVCGSLAGNAYADGSADLPASTVSGVYNRASGVLTGAALGKFTRVNGDDGVAEYLAFKDLPGAAAGSTLVQGRIGYVGVTQTIPYSTNVGLTGGLVSAALQNSMGTFVKPTPASTTTAFGALAPPQSNATGGYSAANTVNGLRVSPDQWVQPLSKTSALANPVHAGSYPIVGTVNWIGYTCYADAAALAVLKNTSGTGILNQIGGVLVTDPAAGILANAGMSALPSQWATAIRGTFLLPTAATRPLNLYLDVAGAGAINTACSMPGVIGG